MTNKPCNRLCWSPSGRYIVFAGIGVSEMTIDHVQSAWKGRLEFWDASTALSLRVCEYFTYMIHWLMNDSCTDVTWSPNGHFCVGMSCYSETSKQDVWMSGG